MRIISKGSRAAGRCRVAPAGLALAGLLTASGCKGILDVENPNNVAESSLGDPQAAIQQVNGVQASTVRMISAIAAPYATTTDELDWTGSREAWNELEKGVISDYLNEFTDLAFTYVGEARYTGDETIKRLEEFDAQKRLRDRNSLVRNYLYTAIAHAAIADMFDDFAYSSKQTPAKPVGRANMFTLYDKAIGYLNKAVAIDTGDFRYALLSTRARIKHAKAVWMKITPQGQTPANPLVNDAGANADALAALALSGGDDAFKMKSNIEAQPGINIWFEVNGRNEMSIGSVYRTLRDPITGQPDPASARLIAEFEDRETSSQDGFFTIVSDRELLLILAESALATNDLVTFATRINAVRSLDALPPWTGQVPALEILKFERQANLFLQMRRLADLYRFGLKVAQWSADPNFKSAFDTPGVLFPIPNVERLANPCVANPSSC